MLKIIRTILQKWIDDIDADNTHLDYEQQCNIIRLMSKADYYGSSITDDKHVALYIKDTIDDEDAADGTTMRRWYATMVANGVMVDWDDSL